jgi:anaerobic selenocysteine-containing dehydrogenase/ferredoxin
VIAMIERIPSYWTLCRSRCGCTYVIEDGRLGAVEPLEGHPTGGALCAKGRAAPELVASPRRLTRPLKRTRPRSDPDPGWVEISWDEALTEIADRLEAIRSEHGAEAVAFVVTTPSGTPMVDSFEWVERFIRLFGSPNLIYAVELCGWHKDYAHALTFGRGIGMPDYDRAKTIVLWGHNPVRTWLAEASRIAEARRLGAHVAVVDPKPDGFGQQADLWLRVRPGSDGALAMGAIRHLIETNGFDRDFVVRWTNAPMLVDPGTGRLLRAGDLWDDGARPERFVIGHRDGSPWPYDTAKPLDRPDLVELRRPVTVRLRNGRTITSRSVFALLAEAAGAYTPERVAEITWLKPAEVSAFNALFSGSPKLAYHSWTGVGQHTNATATERSIATLYALTGACDKAGGNLWPVLPSTRSVNDYDFLPRSQQAKALGLDQLPLGPPCHGWITARDFNRAVLDGEPYKVRALVGFGTNFVVSQGHFTRNRESLQALEFHVHVDMFMNPTAESADIVLPANLPWERDALKIGLEITQAAVETIQFRPKMLEPPGDCRADYEIAAALAVRLGMADRFFGGSIEAGWNHQLAPLGVTIDTLRQHPAGRRFPQAFRYEKYAAATEAGEVQGFATPSKRVELYSEQMLDHGYAPLPCYVEPADGPTGRSDARFPFVLTTAKSGWFIHSSYRHVASLRRKRPDPTVEISPDLVQSRGLHEQDWAIVATATGTASLRVHLNTALDPRVVIADFGWWEDCPPLGLEAVTATGRGTSNVNDILSDDRPGEDFDVAGHLDPAVLKPLLPERPLAYLCGSPGFTKAMTDRLIALGLPRFDIFTEVFTSPPEVPKTLAPRTVHIAGTGRSFAWTPESGTILDAALRAGIALPSGCRAGQCESCAVHIESGQVAHLCDYAGEACLTCQAVPLTELTLAI